MPHTYFAGTETPANSQSHNVALPTTRGTMNQVLAYARSGGVVYFRTPTGYFNVWYYPKGNGNMSGWWVTPTCDTPQQAFNAAGRKASFRDDIDFSLRMFDVRIGEEWPEPAEEDLTGEWLHEARHRRPTDAIEERIAERCRRTGEEWTPELGFRLPVPKPVPVPPVTMSPTELAAFTPARKTLADAFRQAFESCAKIGARLLENAEDWELERVSAEFDDYDESDASEVERASILLSIREYDGD